MLSPHKIQLKQLQSDIKKGYRNDTAKQLEELVDILLTEMHVQELRIQELRNDKIEIIPQRKASHTLEEIAEGIKEIRNQRRDDTMEITYCIQVKDTMLRSTYLIRGDWGYGTEFVKAEELGDATFTDSLEEAEQWGHEYLKQIGLSIHDMGYPREEVIVFQLKKEYCLKTLARPLGMEWRR